MKERNFYCSRIEQYTFIDSLAHPLAHVP